MEFVLRVATINILNDLSRWSEPPVLQAPGDLPNCSLNRVITWASARGGRVPACSPVRTLAATTRRWNALVDPDDQIPAVRLDATSATTKGLRATISQSPPATKPYPFAHGFRTRSRSVFRGSRSEPERVAKTPRWPLKDSS